MSIQKNTNPDGIPVALEIESKDSELKAISTSTKWSIKKVSEDATNVNPPNILADVQQSHKQITDRFVELLNLFEDYSKIMESEQVHFNPLSKLKRTQSEQFPQPEPDSSEPLKTTLSLNRMQLSDCTLLNILPKVTCEAICQTSWSVLPEKDNKMNLPTALEKPIKIQEVQRSNINLSNQQTLHIEVESVSSSTALQRAPLRQRLWQVLVEAWHSMIVVFHMMGDNFTYVLFIVLCMWCLYLIIGHYYSFLDSNATQKIDIKKTITPIQAHPI